ncbi:MAG: hypothetical protein WA823_03435 [Candidatus Acidiferrales bacterium]
MFSGKPFYLFASLLLTAVLSSPAVHAQTPSNCTASQTAAVQCFVANAVTTDITKPRYGMTLTQFESYGVAVSNILQSNHTYLVLVGLSSAVANAMPPTNANGSANLAAQSAAVNTIVESAVYYHIIGTSTGVSTQDLQWFSLDVADAMNSNSGYLDLLTPGVSFRMIDSYLVTYTSSNGTVNWTEVNSSLTTAVQNFVSSGLIKIPAGISQPELVGLAESIARAIGTYKEATGRKSL